ATTFSVTAAWSARTYQWRKDGVNFSDGWNVSGATTATLTINPAGSGDTTSGIHGYDCVVSGTCSPAATSTRVNLTVTTSPSITTQPASATRCVGGSATF